MNKKIPIKILVIGDSMVGKTSYANKLSKNEFSPFNSTPTIGNNIIFYEYNEYEAIIWDTTGQEKFRSLMPNYYREADGAFCMFSVDDLQSLYHLSYWINEFKYYCPEKPFLVIGSKYDLENKEITDTHINEFCEIMNCDIHYVSSVDGTNIKEVFHLLMNQIIDSRENNQKNDHKEDFIITDDNIYGCSC